MKLFVIGDVHGCYYTFQELLGHWRPEEETLIQLGDLMDRGNHGPETVSLAMELEARYPTSTVFLKGNHEAGILRYFHTPPIRTTWPNWGGDATLRQYEAQPHLLEPHLAWIRQRPLFWENDRVVVSHAGFADTPNPLSEENADGVLWRRGPLRPLGKLQIIGHSPTNGQPVHDPVANALNIDTAAVYGHCLTGVKISAEGQIQEFLSVPTHRTDSARVR